MSGVSTLSSSIGSNSRPIDYEYIDKKILGGLKGIQISISEELYSRLCSNGLKGKVLKEALKEEVTDLIDAVLGARQTFIHYEKEDWLKVYRFLYCNNFNRVLICGEDFTVSQTLQEYLTQRDRLS